MKQLEMIRRVCFPIRARARSREDALSVSDIGEYLSQQDIQLTHDQIEKLMQYVVMHDRCYYKEGGKYYYVSQHYSFAC